MHLKKYICLYNFILIIQFGLKICATCPATYYPCLFAKFINLYKTKLFDLVLKKSESIDSLLFIPT